LPRSPAIPICDIIDFDEPAAPTHARPDFRRADACRSCWSEIEALLRAAGAEISEGAGSRVRVALGGVRAVFHQPHPGPETRRGLVRAIRDFLAAAGVEAEKE